MLEKVNPSHINKIADRIAGAMVDEAYRHQDFPNVSVEVMIGHGICDIIAETSYEFSKEFINQTVERITNDKHVRVFFSQSIVEPIDIDNIKCGDNACVSVLPLSDEEKTLSRLAREVYSHYPTSGKYFINNNINKIIICQSESNSEVFRQQLVSRDSEIIINPLGDYNIDSNKTTGSNNSQLFSDLGRTLGTVALHGRDATNTDVVLAVYAFLKAQESKQVVTVSCCIGDDTIEGYPFSAICKAVRHHILNQIGGFEKMAEWGLL